jgi:hypothetical protein
MPTIATPIVRLLLYFHTNFTVMRRRAARLRTRPPYLRPTIVALVIVA